VIAMERAGSFACGCRQPQGLPRPALYTVKRDAKLSVRFRSGGAKGGIRGEAASGTLGPVL